MPTSTTVESKPMSDEPQLIPVPDEDNADSEFGIAEFESNRPSSPEEDDIEPKHQIEGYDAPADETAGIMQPNQHLEIDEVPSGKPAPIHNPIPGDDNCSEQSSDSELDRAILGNDQLAYELAHDTNGLWTDPTEDERSAQLFLNELSDHQ